MNVGIEIRVARIRAGLKQTELAAALGVSQVLVSRWERGEIKPTEEMLRQVTVITEAQRRALSAE